MMIASVADVANARAAMPAAPMHGLAAAGETRFADVLQALAAQDTGSILSLLWQILLLVLVGLLLAVAAVAAFVVVSLFVAFLREPLVGFLAAICRFVTWPLAAVARGALRGRAGLLSPMRRAFAGLRYGPEQSPTEEPSSWQGWNVLGPLVYLSFLLLLGLGDFYLMVLRLQVLLEGDSAQGLALPIPLDLLSGVLWVVMVATFASVLFDLHGATPIARPFHHISPGLRRTLKIVVWAALALSFVAAGLFWLWGQLKIDLQANPIYAWIFTVLFAVLLNVAVFLSGWAVPAALAALYALVLGSVRLVLWLLYGVIEIVVRLLNGLTRVAVAVVDIPARAGRAIYNWATRFEWARNRFLSEMALFEPPDLPGVEVDDLLEVSSGSSSAQSRIPPMIAARMRQDTVIAGLGNAGERLTLDLVRGEAPLLGPATVLAAGAVNDALAVGDAQSTRLRVRNVSPTPRELRAAADAKANPARARQQLVSDMIDRLIKAQSLSRVARGHMLVLADLSAIDDAAADTLADVDRRIQGETVVLCSLLPHRGQRSRDLAESFGRVLRLHHDGALAGTILLDPTGPFAAAYGEALLSQFIVVGLAGLFGGAAYGQENPTVAEVMASLGERSGLIGMACAGRRLIPLTGGAAGAKNRGGSPFPEYRLAEMVAKAVEATDAALGEEFACILQAAPNGSDPVALVYTVPLHPQDPRWEELEETVRAHLTKRTTPPATLFVPGMGLATDGVAGRDYGVQVTAFYPISRYPEPMRPYIVDADSADSSTTNPAVSLPSVGRRVGRDSARHTESAKAATNQAANGRPRRGTTGSTNA